MSNPQFEIVLKGVIAGFDSQQAQTDFAALFSLDADKTARMFAASRTVLKRGLIKKSPINTLLVWQRLALMPQPNL